MRGASECILTAKSCEVFLRPFQARAFSPSPSDAGAGQGTEERGSLTQRPSSPWPSPPSDGGEGVYLVSAGPHSKIHGLEEKWVELIEDSDLIRCPRGVGFVLICAQSGFAYCV
jgi:hypothetical protein